MLNPRRELLSYYIIIMLTLYYYYFQLTALPLIVFSNKASRGRHRFQNCSSWKSMADNSEGTTAAIWRSTTWRGVEEDKEEIWSSSSTGCWFATISNPGVLKHPTAEIVRKICSVSDSVSAMVCTKNIQWEEVSNTRTETHSSQRRFTHWDIVGIRTGTLSEYALGHCRNTHWNIVGQRTGTLSE